MVTDSIVRSGEALGVYPILLPFHLCSYTYTYAYACMYICALDVALTSTSLTC